MNNSYINISLYKLYIMSNLNVNNNHPIIPNLNTVIYENKLVSINSEDRNMLKYPSAADFEIELPQDYCNVVAVNLAQWSFPSNIHVFTPEKKNTFIAFKILNPYSPAILPPGSIIALIADAIRDYCDVKQQEFVAHIESGYYSSKHMATELTRTFNQVVTDVVSEYISINGTPAELAAFEADGYNEFVVVYNEVTTHMWFGNKRDEFIFVNNSNIYNKNYQQNTCTFNTKPCYQFWGLPAYLGLIKDNQISTNSNKKYMRFNYGDVVDGDNGYWIRTNSTDTEATVYYLESTKPIDILGEQFIYIEIDKLNNIDETKPFIEKKQPYINTNETNGTVNSSFAKIDFPLYQQFKTYNYESLAVKQFNPPAERIRSIRIRVRYHSGEFLKLTNRNFSITLNFYIARPQIPPTSKAFTPLSGLRL